jgi:hypothetical protein
MKRKFDQLVDKVLNTQLLEEAHVLPKENPSSHPPGQHPKELAHKLRQDIVELIRTHGENPELWTELKRALVRFGGMKDPGDIPPQSLIFLGNNGRVIRD